MALRVAVVGMGNIGNIHAGVYEKHPDAEIVAVCDIIEEKAKKASERYKCPGFTSVQQMLASGIAIDAASMCTAGEENGADHYQPTMELLRGGIPVLGEKPISNNVSLAREMVALAQEKGLRYGVNLNHRFTPAAERARDWVREGRLGEINIINMTMWINNPRESSPWFHLRALHPHSIDVMRYFCGDVVKVHALCKKGKGRTIWSNLQANFLFESGVIGHLTGSYDAGAGYGLETLEVVGSDARFIIREACQSLEFYPRHNRQVEKFENLGNMTGFPETFPSRISRWVAQNIEGVRPEEIDGSGRDALKAQLVIEAMIESWETGEAVAVAEI